MRKINLFLMLLSLGVAGLFTSCDETGDAVGPEIQFFSSGINADATVAAGETVSFSWQAKAGDANLSEFTIRIDGYDVDGWPNEDIDKDEYEDTFDTVFTTAGEYDFLFIVEDKDGEVDEVSIVITVTESLTSKGSFELGASGNATLGSYYSVELGVMLSTAAQDNADKVDIVFDADASAAKLTSPSNSSVSAIADAGRLTTFEKVTMAFADITSADLDAADPSDEEVTVAEGDVVIFETYDDEMGVLEVSGLTVAADGSVTIEVKVK